MNKILEWLGLKKKKKEPVETPRRSRGESREIDKIFDLVDSMCWACDATDDWTPLDNLLKDVDIEETPVVILLAWLAITGCVRSKLSHRSTLVEAVKEKTKNDPDREGLLRGLE